MKQKTSAKDAAFEKERGTYRKRIRELEQNLLELRTSLVQKDAELSALQNELSQKEDWVRRLLEYTELSEEEMKAVIEKDKSMIRAAQALENLVSFPGIVGGRW